MQNSFFTVNPGRVYKVPSCFKKMKTVKTNSTDQPLITSSPPNHINSLATFCEQWYIHLTPFRICHIMKIFVALLVTCICINICDLFGWWRRNVSLFCE